jgi:hypothetical protein
MEDVLDVYTRPHDPEMPLVCLDETSKQLVAEMRAPIPMTEGRPARIDYEYERNGTANVFMLFAPLEGWRRAEVTDRRTAIDYAHILKDLSDIHFPRARRIVLVQDKSQHARQGLTLRSLRPCRGQAPRGALRMALHAQAWKLAEHG